MPTGAKTPVQRSDMPVVPRTRPCPQGLARPPLPHPAHRQESDDRHGYGRRHDVPRASHPGRQVLVVRRFRGALIALGLAIGLALSPCTDAIMGAFPEEELGVGSAVNDTAQELGGAIGIARSRPANSPAAPTSWRTPSARPSRTRWLTPAWWARRSWESGRCRRPGTVTRSNCPLARARVGREAPGGRLVRIPHRAGRGAGSSVRRSRRGRTGRWSPPGGRASDSCGRRPPSAGGGCQADRARSSTVPPPGRRASPRTPRSPARLSSPGDKIVRELLHHGAVQPFFRPEGVVHRGLGHPRSAAMARVLPAATP